MLEVQTGITSESQQRELGPRRGRQHQIGILPTGVVAKGRWPMLSKGLTGQAHPLFGQAPGTDQNQLWISHGGTLTGLEIKEGLGVAPHGTTVGTQLSSSAGP